MRRRRFLQASVSAPMVLGAGRSYHQEQEQPTELSIFKVEIENLSSEDVTFTVEVLTGSETVFESSERVSAKDAVVIDQPVDEPEDYSLKITAVEQTATQDLSLFADEGDSCVLPVVRLDQGVDLHIEGNGYSSCSS